MAKWSVEFKNHLQHKFAHVIKELTRNFEVEFKTSFCKSREMQILELMIGKSLSAGVTVMKYLHVPYIQTASYPAK